MVFISSSQEWLTQSAALLEARPTTTYVTTKYSIEPARSRAARKSAKNSGDNNNAATDVGAETAPAATTKPPRGKLIIKTYNPQSGVCLKYKTSKAAEVGRLIQMLGSMARKMAALPELPAPTLVEEGDGMATGTAMPLVAGGQQAAGAGSGEANKGGKKKKKGKR